MKWSLCAAIAGIYLYSATHGDGGLLAWLGVATFLTLSAEFKSRKGVR
jgi:hypothetical protein